MSWPDGGQQLEIKADDCQFDAAVCLAQDEQVFGEPFETSDMIFGRLLFLKHDSFGLRIVDGEIRLHIDKN